MTADFRLNFFRPLVGKLVKVTWADPEFDWPYFVVERVGIHSIRMRGADYPDGSAKHEGGIEFCHPEEFANVEPISTSSDSDGWMVWEGGECPVPANAFVEVEFRDGVRNGVMSASWWSTPIGPDARSNWEHCGTADDIVRYRILP